MSRRSVLEYFEKYSEYTKQRVAEGIEAYRKGDFEIRVVDANGAPVTGVTVEAELANHEFNFGSNIFMLDTLVDYSKGDYPNNMFAKDFDVSALSDYEERNEKYKEAFLDLFNYATIPFYWDALEPEEGKLRYTKDEPHIHRRPTPADCIKFCKEHGIRMKSHGLVYDGMAPKWVKDIKDVEEVKRLYTKRMKECAELFADDIPLWEVTNESLCQSNAFWDRTCFFLEDDFVEWSFKEAKKYFPNNQLAINDFHEVTFELFLEGRSWYYTQIKRELAKGTPVENIGMQCHFFFPREKENFFVDRFYNPKYIYDVLDRYGKLGLPIHITECTFPAYSNDPEDEAIQAEIIRNMYSIWFSHPALEGIVYWNFVDGYMEPIGDVNGGDNQYFGGFLRFDYTKKPAWDVVHHLIKEEWHTKECLTSEDTNRVAFRGFYGDYKAKIKVGDKEVETTFFVGKNSDKTVKITLN